MSNVQKNILKNFRNGHASGQQLIIHLNTDAWNAMKSAHIP